MKKLDGTVTLALLDEDNSQRVIFRIIPLCTKDGLVFSNRKTSYPDFGSIRIIPDKREQSSFKERMRELGSLCCVQLISDGKELTKIRQNRNYDPNQGEHNQYAIYSDVICGFEDAAIFEVYQEDQDFTHAMTENVLIQRGKVLFGPVCRDATLQLDALKPFGNEEYLLHTVDDLDGNQRAFYWNPEAIVSWRQRKKGMKKTSASKHEPETALEQKAEIVSSENDESIAAIASDSIPIGTKLEILSEDLTTEEQITELNKPVSTDANRLEEAKMPIVKDEPQEALKFHGTPIAEAPKNGSPDKNKNGYVHNVVEKQIKERHNGGERARADRRMVENPIESLREALQYVWSIPSLQQDLIRLLGENNDIAKAILESSLMDTQTKSAYSAAKAELDEIEGERISLLVELDKVKDNYQQIKEKMYQELAKQKQKEIETMNKQLEALTAEKQTAEETLKKLGDGIQKGTLELLAGSVSMDVQTNGSDIVLSPTIGTYCETIDIVENVRSTMSNLGFMCKRDCVTEFMVFLSIHDEVCITGDKLAETELYVKNVLRALGLLNVTAWPSVFGSLRIVSLLPENDLRTPTVEVILSDRTPIRAYGHKTIRILDKNNLGSAGSLPVLWVPEYKIHRNQEKLHNYGSPVSLRSIHAFANRADLLYKDGEEWLVGLKKKLTDHDIEVPNEIGIAAYTFVRAATPQLVGGLMEAVDTAALAWIVPKLITWKHPKDQAQEIIGNLPKSMRFLSKAEY